MRNHAEIAGGHEMIVTHDRDGLDALEDLEAPAEVALGPGADLREADLQGADLQEADLQGADLRDAARAEAAPPSPS